MNEVMHAHDVNRQRPRYPSIGPIDEEVRMIGRHVLPVMPEHLLISHVAGKFICVFLVPQAFTLVGWFCRLFWQFFAQVNKKNFKF